MICDPLVEQPAWNTARVEQPAGSDPRGATRVEHATTYGQGDGLYSSKSSFLFIGQGRWTHGFAASDIIDGGGGAVNVPFVVLEFAPIRRFVGDFAFGTVDDPLVL